MGLDARKPVFAGFANNTGAGQPALPRRLISTFVIHFLESTRGTWKVLSMVFYLSNRFTNPIMFGIILKSYLSSMLWHKFHEDIIMQTRKNIFLNTCTVCILEKAKFQWNI